MTSKYYWRAILATLLLSIGLAACGPTTPAAPQSSTGVKKADAVVKVQASGLTVEQENIKRRIEAENSPGAIKHFYLVSAYSGQVILYSTVKGKVTSSSKRLTPYSVAVAPSGEFKRKGTSGFMVAFGDGYQRRTSEVLQDDGTYGSSIPYLYWWDAQGRYHQHYVVGGAIPHISDEPMQFGSVTLNVETAPQQ